MRLDLDRITDATPRVDALDLSFVEASRLIGSCYVEEALADLDAEGRP